MLESLFGRLWGSVTRDRRERFVESIEGQPPNPDQLRALAKMVADAFLTIRSQGHDADLAFAVADAFHNLPVVMHDPRFSWSMLLHYLRELEREFPEVGGRFIASFDEIVGFRAFDSDTP
jgi:hypothetical protein